MYRCALANDYLHPDFRPISHEHLEYLPEYEVLALATGSQGEPMGAMNRIINGTHPEVFLESGDCVIFSSKIIPGNEKKLYLLQNKIVKDKIEIIGS